MNGIGYNSPSDKTEVKGEGGGGVGADKQWNVPLSTVF